MNTEDRVRDALHEYADPIEPAPGSWDRIASRFDEPVSTAASGRRGPSRATSVFAVAALALLVVLITTLVVRDGGESSLVVTGPSGSGVAAGEASMVVALGRQLVEIDPGAGDVRRVLWEHDGITELSVAADGRSVYVVTKNPDVCRTWTEAFKVPLDGGPAEKVTGGISSLREFELDGRTLLAYTGAIDCSDAGRVIQYGGPVVPGRDTDGAGPLDPGGPGIEPPLVRFPDDTTGVRILDAAPNGRRLLLHVSSNTTRRLAVVDVPAGTYTFVPTNDEWTGGAAFAHDNFLHVMDTHNGGTGPQVVDLQGQVISGVVPWVEGSVTFDSLESTGDGRLLGVTADGALYREGERITLPGPAIAAAWLPGGDAEASPATEMPKGIAVVRSDGRVADISPVTGEEHSTLMQVAPGAEISATDDGQTLAVASETTTPGCVNPVSPRLTQRAVVDGAIRAIASGAYSPAVGPQGLVAYGYNCDGNGLGMTRLATGENHRMDALGGRESETDRRIDTVEPLGWSPDGTRLLYWVRLQGEQRRRLYVGKLWPAVRAAQTEVVEIPGRDQISAATFVDDETLAIAVRDEARTRVDRMPLELAERFARQGFDSSALLQTGDGDFSIPGGITQLVADRSGRHLLVVTDDGRLLRWSRDDAEVTQVAEGVTAATWLAW
jgi:hypothetical protein